MTASPLPTEKLSTLVSYISRGCQRMLDLSIQIILDSPH